MLQGQSVPPTPYAPEAHTRIHTAFMKSRDFQGLDQNDPQQKAIIDNFAAHVLGEAEANKHRSGQQPSEGTSLPIKGVDGQSTASKDGMTMPGSKAGSSPVGGFMRRMLGVN
jgi:hypothetical protein